MTGAGTRVAVLGAGLAGLSAAHALLVARPDLEVRVYEGSGEVGGKLRTGQVAGIDVDLGAESMLSRRPEGLDLATAVGLRADVVTPATSQAGVWTRGVVRTLPPTLMGIPSDLAALARTGILSSAGLGRASLERRLPPPDLSDDIGVGELVARRLGRDVRDRLVEPLLGGVYAGRADDISMHAALPQVVQAINTYGGLLNAARATRAQSAGRSVETSPVFSGIRGGMARLAQQTAREVERRGAVIHRNSMVREIRRTPAGWQLVIGSTTESRLVECDAVIVATPAAATARLLREVAPVAARELGRIDYASIALVTLAMRAAEVNVPDDRSGFLVPPLDGKIIKAATFSSSKWLWLRGDIMIVRCSIGRYGDEVDLQRDDAELVDAAAMDLREAVGLQAPLVDAVVTRWGGGLPQYAVGHLGRVRQIEQSVAATPGLAVCGAALRGVGISAVIASGQAAATRVLKTLEAVETMES
ncbi:MAG: protoporphyrinogen oxidase [Nocardioidaceae bacterium]